MEEFDDIYIEGYNAYKITCSNVSGFIICKDNIENPEQFWVEIQSYMILNIGKTRLGLN